MRFASHRRHRHINLLREGLDILKSVWSSSTLTDRDSWKRTQFAADYRPRLGINTEGVALRRWLFTSHGGGHPPNVERRHLQQANNEALASRSTIVKALPAMGKRRMPPLRDDHRERWKTPPHRQEGRKSDGDC